MNHELLAQMFVRAIMLNSKKDDGKTHTDAPCVIWEEQFNLDNEILPGYANNTSRDSQRGDGSGDICQ